MCVFIMGTQSPGGEILGLSEGRHARPVKYNAFNNKASVARERSLFLYC